jgi:hypothetical protein
MSGTRGKCRCRRIALRLKAGESLAAEFVECLNGTAEITQASAARLRRCGSRTVDMAVTGTERR